MDAEFNPRLNGGGRLEKTINGWRFVIPAGKRGIYQLSQLDDCSQRPRRTFFHRAPFSLSLCARVSANNLPGTWGFGLWNDPFGFSIGFGATPFRLPCLPNAIWFFHASKENYLSLQSPYSKLKKDIPANGFFAGSFLSPRWPSLLLAPATLTLPLLAIRPAARLVRRLAGRLIQQDDASVSADVTDLHRYTIIWLREGCEFRLDNVIILRTPLSPPPPLGLVIWMDNQFARFTPDGRLGYGTLESPDMWMEIEGLEIVSDSTNINTIRAR